MLGIRKILAVLLWLGLIGLASVQAQSVTPVGQLSLPDAREAGATLGLAADSKNGFLYLFTVNAAYRYDLSGKNPEPVLYTSFSRLNLQPASALAFVPTDKGTPQLFLTTVDKDLAEIITLTLTEGEPTVTKQASLSGIRSVSGLTLAVDSRTGSLRAATDDGKIYDVDPEGGRATEIASIENISTIGTGEQSRVVVTSAGDAGTLVGSKGGGVIIDDQGKVNEAPKELSDNHKAGYDDLLAPPLIQADFSVTMNREESAFFTFRGDGGFTGSSTIPREVLEDTGAREGIAQLAGGSDGTFYFTSGTGNSIWIFNYAAVPEPIGTGVALAAGSLLLAAVRRREKLAAGLPAF